jgi:hypothetical protein
MPWFLIISLLNLLIFTATELGLWSKFDNPDHPIERRHLIIPTLAVDQSIFGEYRGSAEIPLTIEAFIPKVEQFRGVRLRTGAYGLKVEASDLKVLDGQKNILCTSTEPFVIAENNWTAPRMHCQVSAGQKFDPRFVRVETSGERPWAVFSGGNGLPAVQLWFEDSNFAGLFGAARNYGGLWAPSALFSLRVLARIFIAFGLAWLIVFWRGSRTHNVLAGLLVWIGLMFGQLAETVSYQNPDETQHAIGAFRSVTPKEGWDSLYQGLKTLGAKVQFKETFTKVDHPIVPGKDGEAWVSDDNFFVDPSVRSGVYALLARPLARLALSSSQALSPLCSDPVMWLRIYLVTFLTILAAIAVHVFCRLGRHNSAWIFLAISSIPAYLSSYLTIWNYGLGTLLGVFMACCLIPEGSSKSKFLCLLMASALLPFLGEFARTQIFWFIVGPIPVVAGLVFLGRDQISNLSPSKNIAAAMLVSLMIFGSLAGILGEMFIPEKNVIMYSIYKLCERLNVPAEVVNSHPLVTLFAMNLCGWLAASVILLGLDRVLNTLEGLLPVNAKRFCKVLLGAISVICLVVFLQKCLSISEPTFLRSLVGIEPPLTFGEHFKEAYRALMSQQFSWQQDYFLVQTFFMAYGWLDITGSWVVYFLFRHLVGIGVLALCVSMVLRPREFVQLYAPMLLMFLIYFMGIWIGAWTGRFTLVGRFVFPAMGIFYVCIILSMLSLLERRPITKALDSVSPIVLGFYFYAVMNAAYGAFYLLPVRFVVGL